MKSSPKDSEELAERLAAAKAAEEAADAAAKAELADAAAVDLAQRVKEVRREHRGKAPVSMEAALNAALDRAEAAEKKAEQALDLARRLRKELGEKGEPLTPSGAPAPVEGVQLTTEPLTLSQRVARWAFPALYPDTTVEAKP